MKEICIVNYITDATKYYGIGTYLENYIYCLNNLGYKINIIELGIGKCKTDLFIKEEGNIRLLLFTCPPLSDIDSYYMGVCRLLRLYISDSINLIFHYNHPAPGDIFFDIIKNNFPLSKSIITIHYLLWREIFQGNVELYKRVISNQKSEKTKVKYCNLINGFEKEKVFYSKFDRIICLSEDTLNLIQNQYSVKKNVWLIPNGMKKDNLRLSENQKKSFRKKFHLSPDEKILLYVGRIEPIKGIMHLLECFNGVIKEYPNCRLVVIGDGKIQEAIKQCKNTLSKVIFTGRMDKETLCRWYQLADIAVFPSFYEECSFVGIEMMMNGLPIVASDGYSVKNMFQDGINAKVARIESWGRRSIFKDNLKKSIFDLLNSDLLSSEIRKGALKTYQSKYSIECMQKGYSNLLNEL